MSCKIFLIAAVTLALLLDPVNLASIEGKDGKRPVQDVIQVVVIGAGAAGVTAAAKLQETGNYNVTLLEAMDRIGGRTYSLKLGDGHIEMGGEWVHGEVGNSVYELMNPLGLLINKEKKAISPLEFGDQFSLPTGENLNSSMGDSFRLLLDYIWEDPEGWGDDFPVGSTGDFARRILNRFNEEFPIHSDPIFLESVYDWAHRVTNAEDASDNWFEKSYTDNGEQYVTLEGFENIPWLPPYSYLSLFEYILMKNVTDTGIFELPSWIKLNMEVKSVVYSTEDSMVEVCTRDGTCFSADHVIFTPSLGVLKANHLAIFQPQLSPKKQSAIENIGFGSVMKYSMEFETPWWPQGYEGTFLLWNDHNYTSSQMEYWRKNITLEELMVTLDDGLPLWCRSILNIFTVDSGSHPNVIRVWITGVPSRFLETMDPLYVQTTIMDVVHKFLDPQFPNITQPIRTYRSDWFSNPFTQGTYSYRTLDSEDMDVWALDIAEPILSHDTKPLVCFAGEATHPNFFSTVHGAYDTGVREFNRIQDWYATQSTL